MHVVWDHIPCSENLSRLAPILAVKATTLLTESVQLQISWSFHATGSSSWNRRFAKTAPNRYETRTNEMGGLVLQRKFRWIAPAQRASDSTTRTLSKWARPCTPS